jgi:hypothetical protein
VDSSGDQRADARPPYRTTRRSWLCGEDEASDIPDQREDAEPRHRTIAETRDNSLRTVREPPNGLGRSQADNPEAAITAPAPITEIDSAQVDVTSSSSSPYRDQPEVTRNARQAHPPSESGSGAGALGRGLSREASTPAPPGGRAARIITAAPADARSGDTRPSRDRLLASTAADHGPTTVESMHRVEDGGVAQPLHPQPVLFAMSATESRAPAMKSPDGESSTTGAAPISTRREQKHRDRARSVRRSSGGISAPPRVPATNAPVDMATAVPNWPLRGRGRP